MDSQLWVSPPLMTGAVSCLSKTSPTFSLWIQVCCFPKQPFLYLSQGRSMASIHSMVSVLLSSLLFQDARSPKRLHSAGSLSPFRGRKMTEACGWTQKLHCLSGTTCASQMYEWLIPGNRKGATPWVSLGEMKIGSTWVYYNYIGKTRTKNISGTPDWRKGVSSSPGPHKGTDI